MNELHIDFKEMELYQKLAIPLGFKIKPNAFDIFLLCQVFK